MIKTDLCVIGAGAAGLSIAAGAALMGAPTVLIERDALGGDCLHSGCIPSKTLLAVAKARADGKNPANFSPIRDPSLQDFAAIGDHLRHVIDEIAPMDSLERYQAMGVRVIQGTARFIDRRRVAVGDDTIEARRFVIATGCRTAIPDIVGLDQGPYLTHREIYTLTTQPDHLIILGAGPTGVETALAFQRLGTTVTLIDTGTILSQMEAELGALVARRLCHEGITLYNGCRVERVNYAQETVTVRGVRVPDGDPFCVTGSHIFLATGRTPNIGALNLPAAGIRWTDRGICVEPSLLTDNRRVFAAGDIAGGPAFTHAASYHASIILRQALFRLPARADHRLIPKVVYTDPEFAEIGLHETEARQKYKNIRLLRFPVADNDRARCERVRDGLIKVVTTARGRILGVAILAPHAGELIQPWQLAMAQNLSIRAMAALISPYPTYGEISKRAAASFYTPSLFSARTQKIVSFLRRFG